MDAKRPKTDVDKDEEGQYSEQTFAHVLKEGEEDFDDYSLEELRQFPELGYDEDEVEQVVQNLKPALRKRYRELRAFHLLQYRTQGKMLPFSDVVRECMEEIDAGKSFAKRHLVKNIAKTRVHAKAPNHS